MPASRIRYLVAKLRAKEISAAEQAELEAYWQATVREHPTADSLNEQEKGLLKDAMFARIRMQTLASVPNKPRRLKAYCVAASLVGLIVATLALYPYLFPPTLTYATAYGQTQEVILPDASVVVLNANSTLTFSAEQYLSQREVWLQGEAFFEVKEAEGATFTVFAGEVAVEVLGTSFNVQDRRGHTQVVLNTGKVRLKLANDQPPLTMKPGELVHLSGTHKKIAKRQVDAEIYSSWKDHTLTFRDTPLQDIAQLLEDNYGYQVRLHNEALRHRRFTGSVPSDDIEMLLDKLSRAFHLQVHRKGQQLTLQ